LVGLALFVDVSFKSLIVVLITALLLDAGECLGVIVIRRALLAIFLSGIVCEGSRVYVLRFNSRFNNLLSVKEAEHM